MRVTNQIQTLAQLESQTNNQHASLTQRLLGRRGLGIRGWLVLRCCCAFSACIGRGGARCLLVLVVLVVLVVAGGVGGCLRGGSLISDLSFTLLLLGCLSLGSLLSALGLAGLFE